MSKRRQIEDQLVLFVEQANKQARAAREKWNSPEKMAPFWDAMNERDAGAVRELIEQGCPFDEVSPSGKTALSFAAFHGELALMKLLVSKGANVRGRCPVYGSPLAASISSSSREHAAQYLLDRGASFNDKDEDHNVVLFKALRENHQIARMLIDQGADINVRDHLGRSPLHVAIIYSATGCALTLMEKGCDPNVACQAAGHTPLMRAALIQMGSWQSALMQGLIEKGANVNAVSNSGDTPLSLTVLAQGGQCVEMIELLIENGASLTDPIGPEALMNIANDTGNHAIIECISRHAREALSKETVQTISSITHSRRL